MWDFERDTIKKTWRFFRKARENYLCAKRAGAEECFNVAASRLYYAIYLAGKEYILLKEGLGPEAPVKHKDFPWRVTAATKDGGHHGLALDARVLRLTADYKHASVRGVEVEEIQPRAHGFLSSIYVRLLGETVEHA